MPTKDQHQTKTDSNHALLTRDVFNKETTEYRDWYVTIVFYIAVHTIEKKLSSVMNQHPGSHQQREVLMNQSEIFFPILNSYELLYKLSKRARYECVEITNRDVENAHYWLEKIENQMLA